VIQTGGKLGMQMLNAHMVQLVRAGIVAPEEAMAKAVEKQDLATSLRTAGFTVEA
jgi:Tfp pilus assembly pilus retraction ATPase PilT